MQWIHLIMYGKMGDETVITWSFASSFILTFGDVVDFLCRGLFNENQRELLGGKMFTFGVSVGVHVSVHVQS